MAESTEFEARRVGHRHMACATCGADVVLDQFVVTGRRGAQRLKGAMELAVEHHCAPHGAAVTQPEASC